MFLHLHTISPAPASIAYHHPSSRAILFIKSLKLVKGFNLSTYLTLLHDEKQSLQTPQPHGSYKLKNQKLNKSEEKIKCQVVDIDQELEDQENQ